MNRVIRYIVVGCVVWITSFVVGLGIAPKKYVIPASLQIINCSKQVMLSQVGTKEATGRNDGIQIAKYLRSVSIAIPAPYCAAFVYYCFNEATDDYRLIPIPQTAVANRIYDYAERKGKYVYYTPKVNDLIVWKYSTSWSGHIERIFEVHKAGWVKTVGANTSNGKTGDQREGNGVFIRIRNVLHPLGQMNIRGLIGWKYE